MRSILILSVSAAFLGGCLTSKKTPVYQQATAYKVDQPGQSQYSTAPTTAVTYAEPAVVSYDSYPAQPYVVQANSPTSAPVTGAAPADSHLTQRKM